MKFRIIAVLFAIFFLTAFVAVYIDTPVSAQSKGRPFSKGSDQLAEFVKARTLRDTSDLPEVPTKGGGTTIDLAGRFDNVMLAKLDGYSEPVAACVTNLGEANNFFGRDLETGEPIASVDLFANELEKTAAIHGMSVPEYRFYSALASEFANGNITMSPGSATFNIINGDSAGEGFNEATAAFVVGEGGNNGTTRGAQRLNVFNAAAAVWAAFLDSSIPTNIGSNFNPGLGCSAGSGVLGSAGSVNIHRNFTGAEFTSTWYHAALANKRANADLVPGTAEIQAQFNTDIDAACLAAGTRFYYGLDNATPAQRVNLFVVVLHEIGHGVGFSSFVNGSTGVFPGGTPSPDIYSRYMWDDSVGLFWNQMTDAQRVTSATNTNNVYWDGPNVRSASAFLTGGRQAGTNRVALYTPNPLEGGSSISHFSTAASPNLLMEPSINAGLPINLDLARQVMRDIGWYRDTTSDNVADTITSVTPNGSFVTIGQQQTIFWVNNGGFNRNVTVELSTDGGTTFSAIATDIANAGSYNWTVPNSPTTTARIRVREAGFVAPSGVSSANFTIQATPAAANVTVSGRLRRASGRYVANALVTFTAPNSTRYFARSNSFGYYRVTGLPAGQTYIGTVTAKALTFPARPVSIASDLQGVDFVSSN